MFFIYFLLFFLLLPLSFRLDRILFFHIIKADSGVSRTNPCDPINPADPESLRTPAARGRLARALSYKREWVVL